MTLNIFIIYLGFKPIKLALVQKDILMIKTYKNKIEYYSYYKILLVKLIIAFIVNTLFSINSICLSYSFDYQKQREKIQDNRGNTVWITPNYSSYQERNKYNSEKIVAIYDKHSPAYGYRYVLYSPIGSYVGHHKIMQSGINGYGYEPIPDGGEDSKTPCFKTILEAKHYYYPQWY